MRESAFIMDGISKPLPGLLKDPQFQILNVLPTRPDLRIAPLREPVPSRTLSIPSPLEPQASGSVESRSSKAKLSGRQTSTSISKKAPQITPATIIMARDTRKHITAISELIESTSDRGDDGVAAQLPSFVSLSVVEKSFLSPPPQNEEVRATKRMRFEGDVNLLDEYFQLPPPLQKPQERAPPLLPAIVNGLHEPPPNAALLPPMELETQPRLDKASRVKPRATNTAPKKDSVLPPEKMLNSPQLKVISKIPEATEIELVEEKVTGLLLSTRQDPMPKLRKPPRKWTDEETKHLLQGVEKHGHGKWKLILDDPAYIFLQGRTAVDLKDRYRVYMSDTYKGKKFSSSGQSEDTPTSSAAEGTGKASSENQINADPPSTKEALLLPNETSRAAEKPSGRRMRRAWTAEEDQNLLRGVVKHGFQWTAIHDDAELSLSHRKATDLRDRIRNRYPDGYKNAESAPLKSKNQQKTTDTVTAAGSKTPNIPATITMATTRKPVLAATTSIEEISPKGKAAEHPTSILGVLNTEATAAAADAAPKSILGDTIMEGSSEQLGTTLPSLALNVDDWDWGNNTLPPLLDWEDMGHMIL